VLNEIAKSRQPRQLLNRASPKLGQDGHSRRRFVALG
jgi:hypothetical protein